MWAISNSGSPGAVGYWILPKILVNFSPLTASQRFTEFNRSVGREKTRILRGSYSEADCVLQNRNIMARSSLSFRSYLPVSFVPVSLVLRSTRARLRTFVRICGLGFRTVQHGAVWSNGLRPSGTWSNWPGTNGLGQLGMGQQLGGDLGQLGQSGLGGFGQTGQQAGAGQAASQAGVGFGGISSGQNGQANAFGTGGMMNATANVGVGWCGSDESWHAEHGWSWHGWLWWSRHDRPWKPI